MPLGRKHLRRNRDAPTGGNWPLKNCFQSRSPRKGSQITDLDDEWLSFASNLGSGSVRNSKDLSFRIAVLSRENLPCRRPEKADSSAEKPGLGMTSFEAFLLKQTRSASI
jgi:hypothetical protein